MSDPDLPPPLPGGHDQNAGQGQPDFDFAELDAVTGFGFSEIADAPPAPLAPPDVALQPGAAVPPPSGAPEPADYPAAPLPGYGAGEAVPTPVAVGPASSTTRSALPAVPPRAHLVKLPRHRGAGAETSLLWHRYAAAVALAVVVVLLVNFVPSVRGTVTQASAASGGSSGLAPGITPPTGNYAPGTTVGGLACGPGVRQVPWSAYAPPCKPAWHGDNGAATSRGVSASTITITYRAASTSQLAELYGLVPPAVVGTNVQAVETMDAYINAFNKDFELYGRHVVLVPFQGKGDFIDEDVGEDQAQAQEDAVTAATSAKAFADISLVDSSQLYTTDLAAQHVLTFSLYEDSAAFYQQYSPWIYTPGPNCTKMAEATGAILGKQLGDEPPTFAGPGIRATKRVYGIIYPLSPTGAACASADANAMARWGHPVVKQVSVKFDLSSLIASADAAVAEMKAAGVTTVILSSQDVITPRFFLEAADSDDYHPEWWFQGLFSSGQTNMDAFTRLFPADQTGQIFGLGAQTQAKLQQEAITAFRLGNTVPGAKPIPSYIWMYESLLDFFDGLQLAGPDLTPNTFLAGMSQIPPSLPWGMTMGWNGADGPYDPASTYDVVHYDTSAVSPLDGQQGTWVACDGGKSFSYDANGADVPRNEQMSPSTCSQASGKVAIPASASYAASASQGG